MERKTQVIAINDLCRNGAVDNFTKIFKEQTQISKSMAEKIINLAKEAKNAIILGKQTTEFKIN